MRFNASRVTINRKRLFSFCCGLIQLNCLEAGIARRFNYESNLISIVRQHSGNSKPSITTPPSSLPGISGNAIKANAVAFSIAFKIAGAGPSMGNSPISFLRRRVRMRRGSLQSKHESVECRRRGMM